MERGPPLGMPELSSLPSTLRRADRSYLPSIPASPIHLCLPCRLAGSKITARGIYHLVQALPLCPHLEEVR